LNSQPHVIVYGQVIARLNFQNHCGQIHELPLVLPSVLLPHHKKSP